jgi:hypothetical protein
MGQRNLCLCHPSSRGLGRRGLDPAGRSGRIARPLCRFPPTGPRIAGRIGQRHPLCAACARTDGGVVKGAHHACWAMQRIRWCPSWRKGPAWRSRMRWCWRAHWRGEPADVPAALARYETARIPRTAKVQRSSLANDWLKTQGNADWVYGYQAWTARSQPALRPRYARLNGPAPLKSAPQPPLHRW